MSEPRPGIDPVLAVDAREQADAAHDRAKARRKATPATTYRVTFDRIGRGSHGLVEVFAATGAADLAEQVFRFVKKRRLIASKDFEVTVELSRSPAAGSPRRTNGWGTIGRGRFGSFSIEVKP